MKLYWPMAAIVTVVPVVPSTDRVRETEQRFTYDAYTSRDKALQQFAFWEDGHHYITEAWIDVYEDGKQTGRLEVEKTWKVKEE